MTNEQEARADERLRQILARPLPHPSRGHSPPDRWKRQSSFYMCDEAYKALKELAPINPKTKLRMPKLVGPYIDAIARANPTPYHWRDTRPDDLKAGDVERLQGNPPKLPLWSYGDGRLTEKRHHTYVLHPTTITLLANLARIYGIGKQTYVSYDSNNKNRGYVEGIRSTTFKTLDSAPDTRLAGYTLQAFALGYLTPTSTKGTDRETLGKVTYPNRMKRPPGELRTKYHHF